MNSKVILYVAIGMSIFGFIVLATGLKMGAKPVVAIGNKQSGGSRELIKESIELSKFDELDVDIASIGTYIEQGDSYRLEYQAYEDNVPKITENNDKLTVKQPSHSTFRFGVDFSGDDEQYYRIIVPEDAGVLDVDLDAASGLISVDSVNIDGKVDIASGLVQIKNVESKELKVAAASGKVELENITTKKLKLDLSSGMMNVDNCTTKDLDAELTSGTMTFDRMTFDKADLDESSGKIELNVVGTKDDYSYDIEATSGSIKIDGNSVGKSYKTDGDKDKEIKADMTSGSLDITFSE